MTKTTITGIVVSVVCGVILLSLYNSTSDLVKSPALYYLAFGLCLIWLGKEDRFGE